MLNVQTFFSMERIIQATINALGFLEDGIYYPEPDCFGIILEKIIFFLLNFYLSTNFFSLDFIKQNNYKFYSESFKNGNFHKNFISN